jgi:CDP-diglyceride synthetase
VSNLAKRVLVAAVAIPLVLGIVWYGGLLLALVVSVAAVLGTSELFTLAAKSGIRPLRRTGMVLAGLAPLATWLIAAEPVGAPTSESVAAALGAIPAWLLSAMAARRAHHADRGARPGAVETHARRTSHSSVAAVTLFGPIYCGRCPRPSS